MITQFSRQRNWPCQLCTDRMSRRDNVLFCPNEFTEEQLPDILPLARKISQRYFLIEGHSGRWVFVPHTNDDPTPEPVGHNQVVAVVSRSAAGVVIAHRFQLSLTRTKKSSMHYF
jgi:hypothetical protein